MDFLVGLVIGIFTAGAISFAVLGVDQESYSDRIEKTCQGTPWVIEEPLIKKTLTCEVVIKEKK